MVPIGRGRGSGLALPMPIRNVPDELSVTGQSDSTINVSVDVQNMLHNNQRAQTQHGIIPEYAQQRPWGWRQEAPADLHPALPRDTGSATLFETPERPRNAWNNRGATRTLEVPIASASPDHTASSQRRSRSREDAEVGFPPRDRLIEIWKERRRLLAEYHNRPRQTINYPLRLLHAFVLSEGHQFSQPCLHWPLIVPCVENPMQRIHFSYDIATGPNDSGAVSPFTSESLERGRVPAPPQPEVSDGSTSWKDNLARLMFRSFFLQCSIAQQTNLIYYSRERQHLVQQELCCDWFFGDPSQYSRTLWTMVGCDVLTCGIPCCLCCGYRGMGTALFGWRVRYLVRCRYGIKGTSIKDFVTMLLCPVFGADQLGTELEYNGMHEFWAVSPPVSYYVLQ